MERPYRVAFVVIGIVLGCLVALWMLVQLRGFLILVLIAAILAAALDRPVSFLHRAFRLPRRGLAVALVLFAGLLILIGIAYLVYQPVSAQSSTLRQRIPDRVERLKDFPLVGPRLENVDLAGETERFLAELPSRLGRNRELVLGVAETAFTGLVLSITVLIITVFLLLNGPRIAESAPDLLVEPLHRARARRLARGLKDAVAGYVLGLVTIAACSALLTFIALEIMRAPFAAVLAVVMFLFNLIPLVGATLGATVVGGITFLLDNHSWKAVVFIALYLIYQQIENATLQPWIMGRAVNISAFSVFLIALAGIELAGFVGALLAIPTGAALAVIMQDVLNERRAKAGMSLETPSRVA